MNNNDQSNVSCTHCACNNPVLNILKDQLFHPSILSKLTDDLKSFADPEGETMIFTGGIIRPIVNNATDTVEAIGIHQGKIVASGALAHVMDAMNAAGHTYTTRTLEATQTLLPGLIEPMCM